LKLHISKMVRSFWAAAAVPALLGVAVALDIPRPAADRPLAPIDLGTAVEGLDSAWVMHTIAELVKQNAERKAELQKEKARRGALEAQVRAQNLRINALSLRANASSSCECPPPPPHLVAKATSWRQLQSQGAEGASDFVRIFKRTLTTVGGADGHRRLRVPGGGGVQQGVHQEADHSHQRGML
jgi:hypothetical protein